MAIEHPVRKAIVAALLLWSAPAFAQAADQPRLDRLARDLDRVESVRAIKALQYALAQDIEAGRWRAASQRFAAQATATWGDRTQAGRRPIEADLQARFGTSPSGARRTTHAQLLLAPVITLAADGQSAKGRWHEVSMLGRIGEDASWTGGIFENEYARGAGGHWQIARLVYHPVFRGSYDDGWHDVDADQAPVAFHYDAASIGSPATLGSEVPAQRTRMSAAEFVARVGRLADSDAVANLQNAYGYYLDRKMWDDVADLFDVTASYMERGSGFAGAEAIRAGLHVRGPLVDGELNDHVQANMLVCVAADGIHARARGLDLGMTGHNDGKAFWSLSVFDNSFVKRDGRWRIEAMRLWPRMRADYAVGWAKSAPVPADPSPGGERSFECPLAKAVTGDQELADPGILARGEQRLQQAAGRDAVEHLTSAFGNYIDDYRWSELGSLFARDGRREAPGVGFYVGPERIERMQRLRYGDYRGPRTFIPIHTMTQPVVSMSPDGTSTKIRTRLLQFNTGLTREGSMMAGIYENEAVLVDGTWKFKTVEIDHTLQTTSYARGWTGIAEGTGQRMIPAATKLLETYPPDSPNEGEIYAPYPALGLMWFHYDNPVSGRAPPLKTPKTAAVTSRRNP